MNQLIDQALKTMNDAGLGQMIGYLVVGAVLIVGYSALNWLSKRFLS